MTIALYPGSFDPIHNGHIDIAERAARLFEQVVVAVYDSPSSKRLLFSTEQRVELARQSLQHLPTVQVMPYRGLTVDVEGFNKLMDEQKKRSQAAQKKTVIELSQIETTTPTAFVGFDTLETPAKVLEVVQLKDKTAVILDTSACYAEMGG